MPYLSAKIYGTVSCVTAQAYKKESKFSISYFFDLAAHSIYCCQP